jgi:hypothetical protein
MVCKIWRPHERGRKWSYPNTDISYIFLEELRKIRKSSVGIHGVPTENRTENVPNTSQDRYRYTNPFGGPKVNQPFSQSLVSRIVHYKRGEKFDKWQKK